MNYPQRKEGIVTKNQSIVPVGCGEVKLPDTLGKLLRGSVTITVVVEGGKWNMKVGRG